MVGSAIAEIAGGVEIGLDGVGVHWSGSVATDGRLVHTDQTPFKGIVESVLRSRGRG